LGRICWSMVGGIIAKKEDLYTSMNLLKSW